MQTIKTSNLTKQFGSTKANDSISIQVNSNEIYGFLGLNGAGKTTLIRMLLGMIKPDLGEVFLFGESLSSRFNLWNDIGYLVETPYSYPNLSVKENLQVFCKLRQIEKASLIDDIIQKLRLSKYEHSKAKALSLGNQQRLGLAKALIHSPKLLILDEPINGLDPEGIVEIRNLLKDLSDNGSTIFLSSHILGEVSKIADRIGIVHEGKLIKELTKDELIEQLIKKIIIHGNDVEKMKTTLDEHNYQVILTDNAKIEITSKEAIKHPEKIIRLLTEKGHQPTEVYLYEEDLEAYFLRNIYNKL